MSKKRSRLKLKKTKSWSRYTEVFKGVFGTVSAFSVSVWMSYRTYQSVRYRYWCHTALIKVSGTGTDVITNLPKCPLQVFDVAPNLPKCLAPVLMSYRTYQSVRYRYWCHTELTEVSGTGIWCRTKPTEMSGTGNTGGTLRYVPYRTHPSLYAVQKAACGLPTDRKKQREFPRTWKRQIIRISLGWAFANPIPIFRFWSGRKNKPRLCKSKQASCCANSDADMVLGSFVCLLVWFSS